MAQRSLFTFLKAGLVALLFIYIVIRIGENTFSWKKAPASTDSAPQAVEIGNKYAALLASKEGPDQKIRHLWNMVEQPAWSIPSWAADPTPLAEEIGRRAESYYKNGNLAQAASHIKILLQWAGCLLHAKGPGAKNGRMNVAGTAVKSVAACPATFRYPAIRSLITALSQSLTDSSSAHIDQLLADISHSETGEGPKNLLVLSNRNILKEELTTYLSLPKTAAEAKSFSNRVTARSWMLVCPLTAKLFHASLKEIESEQRNARKLREEIRSLGVDDTDPPLPR